MFSYSIVAHCSKANKKREDKGREQTRVKKETTESMGKRARSLNFLVLGNISTLGQSTIKYIPCQRPQCSNSTHCIIPKQQASKIINSHSRSAVLTSLSCFSFLNDGSIGRISRMGRT